MPMLSAWETVARAVSDVREGSTPAHAFVDDVLDAIIELEAGSAVDPGALYAQLPHRVADELRRAVQRRRAALQRPQDGAGRGALALHTLADLRRAPAPSWRVHGVIPERGLVVAYGASGSGKSFAILDVCAAVARGVPWAGRRTRQGAVGYFAGEGRLLDRLAAYVQHHGLADADLDRLHVHHGAVNLLDEHAVGALIDALRTINPSVVVVDTLARCLVGGDENSAQDMGRAVAALGRIEAVLACAVVVIHHAGKDEGRGARGHSSLRAAADVELCVSRNGDVRTLTATKLRDGADDEVLTTFKLRHVDLGPSLDPDAGPGEQRASCVVDPVAGVAEPKRAVKLSDVDAIALTALKDVCARSGETTARSLVQRDPAAALAALRTDPDLQRVAAQAPAILTGLNSDSHRAAQIAHLESVMPEQLADYNDLRAALLGVVEAQKALVQDAALLVDTSTEGTDFTAVANAINEAVKV